MRFDGEDERGLAFFAGICYNKLIIGKYTFSEKEGPLVKLSEKRKLRLAFALSVAAFVYLALFAAVPEMTFAGILSLAVCGGVYGTYLSLESGMAFVLPPCVSAAAVLVTLAAGRDLLSVLAALTHVLLGTALGAIVWRGALEKQPKYAVFGLASMAVFVHLLICGMMAVYAATGEVSRGAAQTMISNLIDGSLSPVLDAVYAGGLLDASVDKEVVRQALETTIREHILPVFTSIAMLSGAAVSAVFAPCARFFGERGKKECLDDRVLLFRVPAVGVQIFDVLLLIYAVIWLFAAHSVIAAALFGVIMTLAVPLAYRGAVFLYYKIARAVSVKVFAVLLLAGGAALLIPLVGVDLVLLILAFIGTFLEQRLIRSAQRR